MKKKPKTILITGSVGLVGSACSQHFINEGWKVIGIDNNSRAAFFGTAQQELPQNHFNVNICDEKAVADLFQKYQFDAIIHAAAQPSHDWATDHVIDDFLVNAYGTVVLLEATRKYCPKATFVFVSTDKVYGENMHRGLEERETRFESVEPPFDESLGLDFAKDRSFFGCSKAAADMYAQQYAARGMTVGIFRPGCITGKQHQGAEQHGFLAYLAKRIKEGEIYTVFGFEGKQVRDQIHAKDLAAAFAAFIEKPKSGVYNIGGGPERAISVLEAAKLLSDAIGKPAFLDFADGRKGDRIWDVHDVTKFRKDYPEWGYQYSLGDIINELAA